MPPFARFSKSTRENITIRMAHELKAKLQIQAVKEKRYLSDLLEEGAILYLQSVKQP